MARSSSFTLLVLLGLGTTALGATPLQVSVVGPDTQGVQGILDAGTPVDFGTSRVGTAVSKVFLVRNAGTETVTLGHKIQVPKGFTLMRRFDTNVLAPGRTTTFSLALNSAAAGPLGGPVTLNFQGAQAGKSIFAVTGTAFGPPSVRTITSSDPAFQTTGQWLAAPRVGGQGQASVAASGTGANTATWTFTGLPPGQYQVAVTWTPGTKHASDAGFTVLNGKVPFTAVPVNQKVPPADFQDANVGWKVLGKNYRITGDTLSVQLTDHANGAVVADAVRIARVGFPGRILSPGEPGFSLTGTKLAAAVGQGQGLNVIRTSGGQATWTISGLVPGQYRISTTWNDNPKGATSVAYTILDGSKALTTVSLNQRQAPADFTDAGRAWKDLGRTGSLHYAKSGTLRVAASLSSPNGPVDLGPIRVERIYNPGAPPPPGGGPDDTTVADAVRFLEQSTWGPNDTEVYNVQTMGIQGYLYNQLNQPMTGFPVLPFPTDDNNQTHTGVTCDYATYPQNSEAQADCQRRNYQVYPLQRAFFTNGLYGPDQLRQRMAWALHKIWVVSAVNFGTPARMSSYLQILDQNALGNYFNIMYGITLNPTMGDYLNMDNSSKSAPNENYAREILQLFTIGLNKLNPDGTPILDNNGYPVPTYTQDTIVNFARAFTGWTKAPNLPPINGFGVTNYRDPMVPRLGSHGESDYHDNTTTKVLLQDSAQFQNIPPGQLTEDDLWFALANIWYHPTLAPFVSKSLIQQLVTSNPTPDYVARVSQVFLDDGTGTQGNLQAVAFAILTDPAARGDVATDPAFGKLREPVQLVLNLLRAFNATSYDGTTYSDGYLNNNTGNYIGTVSMDQDVLRPATVFSYFLPGFALPGDTSGQNLVGPEFQLFYSVTTFRRINMVNGLFMTGTGTNPAYGIQPSSNGGLTAPYGTKPDLSVLKNYSDIDPDPNKINAPYWMSDYCNYLLMHSNMSSSMYGWYDGQGNGDGLAYAIWKVAPNNPIKRAQTAAYLVGTSSAYQVQQ
jgi:uncharacterized protein (DUF1800 family)